MPQANPYELEAHWWSKDNSQIASCNLSQHETLVAILRHFQVDMRWYWSPDGAKQVAGPDTSPLCIEQFAKLITPAMQRFGVICESPNAPASCPYMEEPVIVNDVQISGLTGWSVPNLRSLCGRLAPHGLIFISSDVDYVLRIRLLPAEK